MANAWARSRAPPTNETQINDRTETKLSRCKIILIRRLRRVSKSYVRSFFLLRVYLFRFAIFALWQIDDYGFAVAVNVKSPYISYEWQNRNASRITANRWPMDAFIPIVKPYCLSCYVFALRVFPLSVRSSDTVPRMTCTSVWEFQNWVSVPSSFERFLFIASSYCRAQRGENSFRWISFESSRCELTFWSPIFTDWFFISFEFILHRHHKTVIQCFFFRSVVVNLPRVEDCVA